MTTPFQKNSIAAALIAHEKYVKKLDAWYSWLDFGVSPRNSEKLVLYKLIRDLIKRRQPGGDFENKDEKIIPTLQEMKDAVEYDNLNSKYRSFEAEIEFLQMGLQVTAKKLVDILNTPEIITEFERFSYAQQLEYANTLSRYLNASEIGLSYLVSTIQDPPTSSKLPIFHPDRLINTPGDFISNNFPATRRAAKAFGSFFTNLIPAFIKIGDPEKFSIAALNFVLKYYTEDYFRSTARLALEAFATDRKIEGILITENLAKRVQGFNLRSPGFINFGQIAAANIVLAVEFINIYFKAKDMFENPTLRTRFDLMSALASLTRATATGAKILISGRTVAFTASKFTLLANVFAVYDVAMRTVDAHEAWKVGDESVATGKALEGVGIAGAAFISVWGSLAQFGVVAAINPVVGGLIVVGSLLVILGGTLLAEYTKDPPLEMWLLNNYFGEKWHSVSSDRDPDHILFKFKRPDGAPHIARQVSAFFSMFFPINVEISWNQFEPGQITVNLDEPKGGSYFSEIAIKRIVDHGGQFPGRYDVNYIHLLSLTPVLPDNTFITPDPDPIRIYGPSTPQGRDILDFWSRPLTFLELSGQSNSNFDPVGSFIEVDISMNDKFLESFSPSPSEIGLWDELPFILRERIRIPQGPF